MEKLTKAHIRVMIGWECHLTDDDRRRIMEIEAARAKADVESRRLTRERAKIQNRAVKRAARARLKDEQNAD